MLWGVVTLDPNKKRELLGSATERLWLLKVRHAFKTKQRDLSALSRSQPDARQGSRDSVTLAEHRSILRSTVRNGLNSTSIPMLCTRGPLTARIDRSSP